MGITALSERNSQWEIPDTDGFIVAGKVQEVERRLYGN